MTVQYAPRTDDFRFCVVDLEGRVSIGESYNFFLRGSVKYCYVTLYCEEDVKMGIFVI